MSKNKIFICQGKNVTRKKVAPSIENGKKYYYCKGCDLQDTCPGVNSLCKSGYILKITE